MMPLPRLALCTPSEGRDPSPVSLALLAGLTMAGWRVQHFRCRARPFGTAAIDAITGLPGRHLDAWLMPPQICREVFARGCQQADIALVEGTLSAEPGTREGGAADRPGRLAPLVDALRLPTLAVVRCSRSDGFHLPYVPPEADALLLDALDRPEDFGTIRHLIELVIKRPVLGAVETLPRLRAALQHTPPDQVPPEDIIERLGASFLRFADLTALRTLAEGRLFPLTSCRPAGCCGRQRFRVAYAQDDAFGGYYPDTLEMLEALGAELLEFSPLRDEALPTDVDLVMIGCGCPERYADELAANLSLISALKHHVCGGHRIYSEGGGTAYLGRELVLGDRRVPGAGILPFDAILRRCPRGPMPVSRVLTRESWLGHAGTIVRGYRSGRWTLRPAPDPGDCPARSGTLTGQRDIYFRHHAIGSLIHLHLAALPQVDKAFAGPHRPSLSLPNARS